LTKKDYRHKVPWATTRTSFVDFNNAYEAIDSQGRTIRIVDAHCGDGRRFVVHADEKLTAFLELEAAIWQGNGHLPVNNSISEKRFNFFSGGA
jgi:hypothetical protein